MEPKTCPKCQGEMEKGLLTFNRGLTWMPEKEIGKILGMDIHASKIISYKCPHCGFLENYAK